MSDLEKSLEMLSEQTKNLGACLTAIAELQVKLADKDAEIERLQAYLTPIQLKHYRGEELSV